VLRALDKLPKIGREAVIAEMTGDVGATSEQAGRILDLAELKGDAATMLSRLDDMLAGSEAGLTGAARLRELFAASAQAGLPAERVELDLSIARGLDYYTGTIYETFLTDQRGIGSVCSGGRYDNLAGLFTKQKLPGVGASLGLDRLLAAMEIMGLVEGASTPADVFIAQFDASSLGAYHQLGRRLRAAGLTVEVFPDAGKVGKQLQYADRKGHKLAVIAGENEFKAGVWQVKNLRAGSQEEVPDASLLEFIQKSLDQ